MTEGAGSKLAPTQVASHALRRYGFQHRFVHLDTTSLSVEGAYERPEEPGVGRIVHGYSRDHRPDLQQVVALLTTYRSALPTWIQALDGHAADSQTFPQMVAAYLAQLQDGERPYLVADSALYSEANLQKLGEVKWLTRVPERIALAKALVERVAAEEMQLAAQERSTNCARFCGSAERVCPTRLGSPPNGLRCGGFSRCLKELICC